MKIPKEELVDIVSTLEEQGHPDPVGFIARSKLLSNFDHSFSSGNKIGFTGIREEDARKLEAKVEDFSANLSAAAKTDIDNFAKYGDIVNMHSAFLDGDEVVQDRSKRDKNFIRRLNKEKKKVSQELSKVREQSSAVPERLAPQIEEASEETELLESGTLQDTTQVRPVDNQLPIEGDVQRLEDIRNSFDGLNMTRNKLPERSTPKSEQVIKNFIRRALANA